MIAHSYRRTCTRNTSDDIPTIVKEIVVAYQTFSLQAAILNEKRNVERGKTRMAMGNERKRGFEYGGRR